MDVDDADHEPSSTVNIRTPDINLEESEPVHLWRGSIVMADVAKFSGVATEVSGDCTRLAFDIGEKVDIVGRIPFDTVVSPSGRTGLMVRSLPILLARRSLKLLFSYRYGIT